MSAAWAGTPASADNARPQRAYNKNRQRMVDIPILARVRHSPMCNCTSWMRHLAQARNPYSRWGLWIPDSLAALAIRNDASQKRKTAATRSRAAAASQIAPSLLLVADAVDRAGPVVGDEHRAILGENYVGRTAEIILVALKPARCEDFLLGILAVGIDDHALDPRALIFVPVPGPVFGDEDVVLVLGGELVAGIELHAERSDVGAEIEHRRGEFRTLVTHRKLRRGSVALVAIGVAEVLADLRNHVELVARHVVAHPVARVLGEPVLSAARID